MKTWKKFVVGFSMLLMLMVMGTTASAATTYGYLNKSINYNTKNLDIRYHAVAPTKFTISAAVSGKTPVTTLRIYDYTTKTYKDFAADSSYWKYDSARNVSYFACSRTVSGTGDIRILVVKDAAVNGRTIAVNVKGSIEKAPASVTAAASTTSAINLNWNDIPGVTGYYVYKSTTKNGGYTKLGQVSSSAAKATGLQKGTTYYFKIRGYYKSGNELLLSKWSSAAKAKTLSKVVYKNKLAELKSNTTYKGYDFNGDGKADTFKYTLEGGKAKIYLGGKYKQTIDLLRGGWFYFCSVDQANTYLIAIKGQYHGQTVSVYKYTNGAFKLIEGGDQMNYCLDYSSPVKISGNVLTINTTPCTLDTQAYGNGGFFKSFADAKLKGRDSLGYNVRFRLEGSKMSLYSRIFTVTGRVGYHAKNSFKTAASYTKLTANDGPIVKAGDKIYVKNIIIGGKNPSEGKNYFQIEVNGKAGWFVDSKNVVLGI